MRVATRGSAAVAFLVSETKAASAALLLTLSFILLKSEGFASLILFLKEDCVCFYNNNFSSD